MVTAIDIRGLRPDAVSAVGEAVAVREATAAERAAWDELAGRFDNCRVFHRLAWIRWIESFSRGRPLYLIFEKAGEVVALLPGFLIRVAFLRIFASPMAGWQTETMGPVFEKDRISTYEMMAALVPFLERRYGVQHIELVSLDLDHATMKALGFVGCPQRTYRMPLFPEDPQRVIKQAKGNLGQNLRKARREGLVAQIHTEEEPFASELFEQLVEVYRRNRVALPLSRDRVLRLFRELKASGNLLAVSVRMPDGGECAAAGFFITDGRELHLWQWAHRAQYGWYCPTELLTWTAMERAMALGCTAFDMGGGGKFKSKFGAAVDETGWRWVRSRYPWLTWLRDSAERAYRWQQSARGRLARPGANGKRETDPGPSAREKKDRSTDANIRE